MEYLIAATVIGLGYIFNNNGTKRVNIPDFESNVPLNSIPTGENIYQSSDILKIKKREQKKANKLFSKTRDPINTNVIIAGPVKKGASPLSGNH